MIGKANSAKVNRILNYYVPIPKEKEVEIWKIQRQRLLESKTMQPEDNIPEDELVEDAGLAEAA